jgi:ribose transport system substrate-binding protein
MSKQATALQPLSGRTRRRWSTLAVATALGASGLLAASNAVLASTDTTEPGSDATAPAATEAEGTAAEGTAAEGTAAEGTAAEGTAAGVSLPAGAGEGIEIAFIQGVIGDEFYISMECGVQEEAARLGATVTVQGPDAFDATLQNPIIDAVVASGPDAILIAPNDVEASAGPLQRAQEAGIQVILVDTVVNDESIGASRIASDNVQGGVMAADALAELIGEEGTVMVVNVNPGISTTDQRQQGFEEQIATYPDIEYIGTEFSNNEPARAAEIITAALAANPELNGVFGTNLFSAQGTATGIAQAGAQDSVSVVGFDAGAAQIEQLEAGDVQALVVQKPYDIGVQGVQQAVQAVTGGEVTPEISTDFVVATADNLEDPEIAPYIYRTECE